MRAIDRLTILTTIAQYPHTYAAELRGHTQELLRWKPSVREWSLTEVITHLADFEEIYLEERLIPTAMREQPSFPDHDQERLAVARKYNEQDALVNLERFARANAAVVQLGWQTADWSRSGIHSEAGLLTFGQLLLRLYNHHSSHLHQMRRIKGQWATRP